MGYTRNEVENILKTLPIGYYIKRGVSVSLSDTAQTAYYDPIKDSITVSYPLIAEVLDGCEDDDRFAEENIRTLLYHEVSHAMLTPKNLRVDTVMNIFEDERIESLLRTYYMGVNFREFIKRINHYKGEAPKSADEAFYQLVRYRVGDAGWLNKLHNLIMKYTFLTRNYNASESWYSGEVHRFYDEFVKWWNENNPQPPTEGGEGDPEPTDKPEDIIDGENVPTGNQDGEGEDEDEGEDEGDSDDETTEINVDIIDDESAVPEELENQDELDASECADCEVMMVSIAAQFADSDLSRKVNSILANIKDFSKRNGSAINAYSGVFDPRAVVRDDCRYFVQKNRLGNAKAYSKTKLNLFIDRSGSFYYNVTKVNRLLKVLADFEKQNPDFSFDLVTMGVGDELCPRGHLEFSAGGGNWLKKDIFDIFNRLQDRKANTYNIVLFDGDAFTDCWSDRNEEFKNFRAFNFKNVSIISDPSNRKYIAPNCKNAHVIYTKDYTSQLYDNVMVVLNKMAR